MSTFITFLLVIGIMGAFVGRGFLRTIGGTISLICGALLFCLFFLGRIIAFGVTIIIILVLVALFHHIFSRRR